jgi:hypothetical protein
MAAYRVLQMPPSLHKEITDLAARDHRPHWKVVYDAMTLYKHLYKTPRDAPANGSMPKTGRPKKPKPGEKPGPIILFPPEI